MSEFSVESRLKREKCPRIYHPLCPNRLNADLFCACNPPRMALSGGHIPASSVARGSPAALLMRASVRATSSDENEASTGSEAAAA